MEEEIEEKKMKEIMGLLDILTCSSISSHIETMK